MVQMSVTFFFFQSLFVYLSEMRIVSVGIHKDKWLKRQTSQAATEENIHQNQENVKNQVHKRIHSRVQIVWQRCGRVVFHYRRGRNFDQFMVCY